MTIDKFAEDKEMDLVDKRFFGELCSAVAGYLHYPKIYVQESNLRMRDWSERLLNELLPLMKVITSRRGMKKRVVIRRK